MQSEKFSFTKRIKSFTYAFRGIKILIASEHNARIHLLAAICVVITGVLLTLSVIEWCLIVAAIGAVFTAEAFNSAIEALCDYCTIEDHELIKKSKDIAAGGVLFTAIAAAAIGLLIFVPKICSYLI
jgi:diacylglycerol kinase (ATP)